MEEKQKTHDIYQTARLVGAASRGDLELVKYTLGKGADINGRDERGNTPLIRAAMHGHEAVVAFLLESGASTGLKNIRGLNAAHALLSAVRKGHIKPEDLFRAEKHHLISKLLRTAVEF